MTKYYLAVDIGASSGRHILAHIDGGRIVLEEVYRFPNGMKEKNGHLCWDIDSLFESIVAGLKRCAELGKVPSYMGIDTWGVDFVLLDGEDKIIGDAVGYRDSRTDGIDGEVYKLISESELYARTGIQKQLYNTVYQLMAVKKQTPEQLDVAQSFLMIPDYLGWKLTGVKHQEYTIATTSQLVNIESGEWDIDVIKRLGYPERLFGKISQPGETLGTLLPQIKERIGYDLTVVHPCSHDTGSAVLAVPTNSDNIVYISSGTWSLMGIELLDPDSSEKAHAHNFTNEGGFDRRFRFLKNIMGLWIIQSIRRELDSKYSFGELCDMAREVGDTPYRISVNDNAFLAPKSMIGAINEACGTKDMPLGELLCCVYHSLAECYAQTVEEICDVVGRSPEALHIIGGGSQDGYLNELTAKALGITVYTGPTEATAIGNVLAQMMSAGEFDNIRDARNTVFESFNINTVKG